jgi:SPOR domain
MERLKTTGAILALVLAAAVTTGCDAFTRDINPRQYLGKEPEMTILLAEYHGPDSRNTANRVAAELKEKGFKKTYVVADVDEAFLCHGVYKKGFEDEDYKKDRTRLLAIRDAKGNPAFGRPWPSLMPESSPMTLYDATAAPGKYTVQVGAFDLYGRKADAVEYTRQLRRRGYPAYTHHGDIQSLVTLGAFGDDIFDNPYRKMDVSDPARIVSPEVKKLLTEFPRLYWNGHIFTDEEAEQMIVKRKRKYYNRRTGKMEDLVFDLGSMTRTRLVHIPKKRDVYRAQPQPTPPGPTMRPRQPRRW